MKRWIALPAVALIVARFAFHPAPTPLIVPPARPAHAGKRAWKASGAPHAGGSAPSLLVDIAGRVVHPGLYHLPVGARAEAAVAAAGGALPGADLDRVDLAALLADGEEVLVPRVGASARRTRTLRAPRSPRGKRGKKAAALVGARVDLNGADANALAAVPGIGPIVAGRILAVRRRDGPFDSLDQLLDVAGMSPSRLEQARPFLHV